MIICFDCKVVKFVQCMIQLCIMLEFLSLLNVIFIKRSLLFMQYFKVHLQ